MFSIEDDRDAAELTRQKVRGLARGCGWLQAVLGRQDRLLARLELLERSQDAPANAALTPRCEDVCGEPDDQGADAPDMNGR